MIEFQKAHFIKLGAGGEWADRGDVFDGVVLGVSREGEGEEKRDEHR